MVNQVIIAGEIVGIDGDNEFTISIYDEQPFESKCVMVTKLKKSYKIGDSVRIVGSLSADHINVDYIGKCATVT